MNTGKYEFSIKLNATQVWQGDFTGVLVQLLISKLFWYDVRSFKTFHLNLYQIAYRSYSILMWNHIGCIQILPFIFGQFFGIWEDSIVLPHGLGIYSHIVYKYGYLHAKFIKVSTGIKVN